MGSIRNSSTFIALIIVVMISAVGCKSKKKAMEASNAEKEKARIEQESALRKQEEEARRKEAEETARRESEREEEARRAEMNAPRTRLNNYFSAISNSGSVASANSSIDEALTMFAAPSTPVLIVISESGGVKDYDRPTTIKDYLNYLKDQKKNINSVADMKVDGSGKITELELRKN